MGGRWRWLEILPSSHNRRVVKKSMFRLSSWRLPVGTSRSVSSRQYGQTSGKILVLWGKKSEIVTRAQDTSGICRTNQNHPDHIFVFGAGGLQMAQIDPSCQGVMEELKDKLRVCREKTHIYHTKTTKSTPFKHRNIYWFIFISIF